MFEACIYSLKKVQYGANIGKIGHFCQMFKAISSKSFLILIQKKLPLFLSIFGNYPSVRKIKIPKKVKKSTGLTTEGHMHEMNFSVF